MTEQPSFPIEEWSVREIGLHPGSLAQIESIFALSNGHIGLRGNFDEGEPHGLPGTYLNSFYELRPLPYAEGGYAYPDSGQTIINVTNGKLIRLLVDDEPFDIRYGEVQEHERELDLRNGVLRRNVHWTSPAGCTINVSSVRMVSFTQRAIAAICYEVEPLDSAVRVVVQSELVANEALPQQSSDPRVGAALASALESDEHLAQGTTGLLVHHTKVSNLLIGAAMDHTIEGPPGMVVSSESSPDVARVSVTGRLKQREKLRIVKFISYGWSSLRSRPAIHDQVRAALSAAKQTGWEGLLSEQRAYLDDFWTSANVELEGDPEVQQAIRFALFHILQAGARAEHRPIPAKGLTGPGYDGHAFWDTEVFVLPVLTMTLPKASADALRWRELILDQAREHARQLNLKGAAFPWRTIRGAECSGYWPAGTAAFHLDADIAYAVAYYIQATGDMKFEEEVGLELLVETARLWLSLGYLNTGLDQFRIDGVTGPDEYSALADNNVYTNLAAQQNLRWAAEAAQRHPDKAHSLGVDDKEITSWREAAEKMYIPYDERLGVTPQDETFTEHEEWNFQGITPDQYPLFLHFTYFDLYRKQVVKQADLDLAMVLFSNMFTLEQKKRNFAYYEPLTVRDSSLSAATQAVMAAEVGQLQLAYDYLGEAAFIDLHDLHHNVRDGVHMASLAGAWTALVAGFGGMRLQNSKLSFTPRLPGALNRLVFHIRYRESRLRIEVDAQNATYRLLDGPSQKILHHGEEIILTDHEPIARNIPEIPIEVGPRPSQPPGREPIAREGIRGESSRVS
ncbi:MAG TPA: glycoside hydrolase family 65 protein [Ktedonobacteraceae bacterium]|nr:glycoside hydrolase family 65 protein [Ktedonobacteraceae bacterium]